MSSKTADRRVDDLAAFARERSGRSARVSVVIPTYNRALDVVRAARSALAQTLPPHQVIVVDDGSTDNTAELVRELPAPVQYIPKTNGGVSSARNTAFPQVTGDYVALLDSDDHWDPRWLETAVNTIEAVPGAGAACCTRARGVRPDGSEIGIAPPKPGVVNGMLRLPDLLMGGMMGSNVVLRTEARTAAGDFDTTLKTGEDIDFALRVAVSTTIVEVAQPLVNVTATPGSLSRNIDTGNRLKVYAKFEQEHPEEARHFAKEFRDARVATTLGYARDLMWARQLPAARERLRESWRYRPTVAAAKLVVKLVVLSALGRGRTQG
jgi:glycosyltransferase involved in cell wall biosynthesis